MLTTTSGMYESQLHSPAAETYLMDFFALRFFALGDQKSRFLAQN